MAEVTRRPIDWWRWAGRLVIAALLLFTAALWTARLHSKASVDETSYQTETEATRI